MHQFTNLSEAVQCDNLFKQVSYKKQSLLHQQNLITQKLEKIQVASDSIEDELEYILAKNNFAKKAMEDLPQGTKKEYYTRQIKNLDKRFFTLTAKIGGYRSDKYVFLEFRLHCILKELEEIKLFMDGIAQHKELLDALHKKQSHPKS